MMRLVHVCGLVAAVVVAVVLGLMLRAVPGCNGPAGDNSPTVPAPTLFVASMQCFACHNGLTDQAGRDVGIQHAWRATMMANAARDPYVLAKVSAEIARTPSLQAVIEDTCATCHTPMARTQLAADGVSATLLGDGLLSRADALHEVAVDGVSCTLCHQIRDEGLGQQASYSGGYEVDTTTAMPDRVTYGPFGDVRGAAAMQSVSQFVPVEGPHVAESAMCGTCHVLFTPTTDAAGNILGQFPEQATFLEWGHSEFAQAATARTCQDCHMPAADGAVAISTVPASLPARSPFSQHQFVGGNTFMLTMLRDHREAQSVVTSLEDLDAVIARATEQLQNEVATLTIGSATVEGGTLSFAVTVANTAGHKFPTGFPSRRAWLHVTVSDAADATVFESGAWQADGRIVGNDGDNDGSTYEPHRDTIAAGDQVQVYESVMADTAGQVTHTLLRAASYAKDNRLLPRGFDKQTAAQASAVVGAALADTTFQAGGDTVTYRVDVSGGEGPFAIAVELLYQSVGDPFVEDLRGGTSNELVSGFINAYDAADKNPVIVATATATAP